MRQVRPASVIPAYIQNMCCYCLLHLFQGMFAELHVCLVTGKEPYRTFGIHVNEKPCVSAEEVQMVKACQKKYWEMLQKVRHICWQTVARCGPWGRGTLLLRCKYERHSSKNCVKHSPTECTMHRPEERRLRASPRAMARMRMAQASPNGRTPRRAKE